jgi:hypothetical protein
MMTFDQLNKYADKLEAEGMIGEATLTAGAAKASPGEIITKACGVYHKVKPFLEVYTSLFFLPKKWKAPVLTFMVFMDGLCPTE